METLSKSQRETYFSCRPCFRCKPELGAIGYCYVCVKNQSEGGFDQPSKLTMIEEKLQAKILKKINYIDPVEANKKDDFLDFFCTEVEEMMSEIKAIKCFMNKKDTPSSTASSDVKHTESLVSQRYKDMLRYNELLDGYSDTLSKKLENHIGENKVRCEHMIKSKIETTADNIHKNVDEMVTKSVSAVKELHKENTEKLARTKKACEQILADLDNIGDNIEKLNKSDQCQKLFQEIMKGEERLKLHEKGLKLLGDFPFLKNYQVQTSNKVTEFLREDSFFTPLTFSTEWLELKIPHITEQKTSGQINIRRVKD